MRAASRVILVCCALSAISATAEAQTTTRPFDPPESARVTEDGWFPPAQRGRELPELPDEVTRAFVIPLREQINAKTAAAMRRKFIQCLAQGAELIIIDMDTPGGAVGATLEITKLIKNELRDIRVVTFVRTEAISGGAFVAMACDEMVLTPLSRIGDAAPIYLQGTLEGVPREKIESYLRTEIQESAELNGYPATLAQAMVSIHLEVWLIRNKNTGELRYVFRRDWRGRVDAPAGTTTAPTKTDAEWELVRVIVRDGELLTMTTSEAQEYGFVAAVIEATGDDPYANILEHYNVVEPPTVLADTWSERLVGFLLMPPVMGFLFFAALLCAYVEINTPGFGVAGGTALVLFAVLFGAPFLVGLANAWEIALIVIGIILIVLEVLVIPGGVVGILGALMCLAGLLGILVPNPPDRLPIPQTDLAWQMLSDSAFALGVGFVAALIGAGVLSKYMPKVPVANKLILAEPAPATGDFLHETSPYVRIQPGAVGKVEAMCRPVGRARFGDELLDVVTEGETIEAGATVRVLYRHGNRLVVERTEQQEDRA
ncbi:MAG: NfeD family protein [Phycisphaerae bacterium]